MYYLTSGNCFLSHRAALAAILAFLLSSSACELINPPEEIPAFLQISEFQLVTAGGEGSDSQKITDGWVYVNGVLLGGFPLPATVPVLQSGTVDLVIDPGIKDNGIESTPEIYPYYQRFSQSLSLEPGQTLVVEPLTGYKENVTFALMESFEEDVHLFREDFDDDPVTALMQTTKSALEGKGSGEIILTPANPLIIVGSSLKIAGLPTDGRSAIYLELDYKNEIPLEIGLRGVNADGLAAIDFSRGLNPRNEWNKAYINLTQPIADSQFERYQLLFGARYPTEDFSKPKAVILLDNIKLIHRRD